MKKFMIFVIILMLSMLNGNTPSGDFVPPSNLIPGQSAVQTPVLTPSSAPTPVQTPAPTATPVVAPEPSPTIAATPTPAPTATPSIVPTPAATTAPLTTLAPTATPTPITTPEPPTPTPAPAVTPAEASTNAPVRVCLDVANIMQNPALPNGCEVVSLAIALNYAGYSVDPVALYDTFMPKSPLGSGDPWTTYVGDAKGQGYGCYAPCVTSTGNAYLASIGSTKTVTDVSGQSLSYYEHLIDSGIPIILWGTIGMNGNSQLCWEDTIDGKYVNWHSYSHCLVLIGYTDDTYIFCDPLEGIVEYDRSAVDISFAVNYRQACIVT